MESVQISPCGFIWNAGRVDVSKFRVENTATKQKRTSNDFRNIQKYSTFSPLSLSIARLIFGFIH